MRELGIVPIADLCHFGVPDWIGDYQNPEWPELFADYAREFGRRYSWVTFFTPVNEIFVNATFSAKRGWWNERLTRGRAWCSMDAAKPQYKNDPRVYFVPGHPVLRTAMPHLIIGLGTRIPGNAIMQWQQLRYWGMSNLKYGTPTRKAITLLETPAGAAALAGAGVLLAKGTRKFVRWLYQL